MVNYIPENKPFYPTDHTGVLRINTNKIHYRYLAYKLEKEGIKKGFSRSYRASIRQIKKLSLVFPSINKQNEAIKKIEKIENLITKENTTINSISLEKNKIIEKYLK